MKKLFTVSKTSRVSVPVSLQDEKKNGVKSSFEVSVILYVAGCQCLCMLYCNKTMLGIKLQFINGNNAYKKMSV